MSIKIMGQVWEIALPVNEKMIMLAMADHADHNGRNIRPGVPLIAWKTDYSDMQVRRIIKKLVAKGLLVEDTALPGKPKSYHTDFSKAIIKTRATPNIAVYPSQNVTPNIPREEQKGTPNMPSFKNSTNHHKEEPKKKSAKKPRGISKREQGIQDYYSQHSTTLNILRQSVGIDTEFIQWEHMTLNEREEFIGVHKAIAPFTDLNPASFVAWVRPQVAWKGVFKIRYVLDYLTAYRQLKKPAKPLTLVPKPAFVIPADASPYEQEVL